MSITGDTELANAMQTDLIDPLVLGYLRPAAVLANLVRYVDLGPTPGTNSYKFSSHGSLVAAATSDGTDINPSADTIASDGTVTLAEVGLAVEVSRLGLAVAGGRVNPDDLAREIAAAVANKIDGDIGALFSSVSASKGTSGAAFTLADFEDSIFTLRTANAPTVVPPNFNLPQQWAGYQWYASEAAYRDLIRALRQANVSDAIVPPDRAGLIVDAGSVAAGALRGTFMGVKLYAGNNAPTSSSDKVSCMFCPAAFGLVTAGGPVFEREAHTLGRSIYLTGTQIFGVAIAKQAFAVKNVTLGS